MEECKIIERTNRAKNKEGWLYGGDTYVISKEELDALLQGKCLCTDINHEYRIFIELDKDAR